MRVYAILLFVAAAHAAIIKRDVSVTPAEAVKFIEIPDITPTQDKDNTAENDPLAPQAPVGQVGNDLRVASELHIPVTIVQDTQYVVKTAADNEVTPPKADEIIRDEEEEVQTPKPGFVQQSIQNLQALQQAAALSIHNTIIKPLQSDTPISSSGSNIIQQSIASLQGALNNGFDSINQAIQNSVKPSAQSDEQTSNQNIITNLQHHLQNNINQLNQTISTLIGSAEGSTTTGTLDAVKKVQIEAELTQLNQGFQTGLKSLEEDLNAMTSSKDVETKQSSNGTGTTGETTSGPFGVFSNIFSGFLNNFGQSYNNTITLILNGFNSTNFNQQSEEGSGNRPIIQGIQTAFNNFQSAITGQTQSDTGSTNNTTNIFNPVHAINQTWQNFQQNINTVFGANQNPIRPTTSENSTKSVVNEEISVSGDSSTKKGHGGSGSGDNNDVGSSSSGIGVKSDPEKVAPEASDVPAGEPAEVPEKSEEAAKPVETEKSVDA